MLSTFAEIAGLALFALFLALVVSPEWALLPVALYLFAVGFLRGGR